MKKAGITLIETLIYTFIFGILLLSVAKIMSGALEAHTYAAPAVNVTTSASTVLERLTREVRGAVSVATTTSIWNTSPGTLVLSTTDASGTAKTVTIWLDTATKSVKLSENAIYQGPLTTGDTRVTSLIFRSLTSGTAKAVRVEMALESGTSSAKVARTFNGAANLRTE